MIPLRRALWCLVCGTCCCAGELRAAIFEFKERAFVVPTGVVRLGDVARISDVDSAQRVQLEQITLAPSPAAGRTVRLAYDDVRQRLLAHGVNLAQIEFRGRSQVLVSTSDIHTAGATEPAPPPAPARIVPVRPMAKPVAEPLVSEPQLRRVRECLAAAFQREFRIGEAKSGPLQIRCECANTDAFKLLAVSAEAVRFEPARVVTGGPQPLVAYWTNVDGQRETATVQAWVQRAPQVLSVKHGIPKGYVLQPADLTWTTTKDTASGLTTLAEVVGKEATRNIRPGQTLQPGDVALVPLVRSNDIVTVLVRHPGLVVRREFKAVSSGALNDTITLVALEDPRTRIQAVVSGYHEATLVTSTAEAEPANATGAIQFLPTEANP
jgi:flagella basal body P-ring formation protein FlgA